MAMIDRIKVLRQAYDWERIRLSAWADEMRNTLSPEDEANPMIVRFADTWARYFDEINKSNDHMINECDVTVAFDNDSGNEPDEKLQNQTDTIRRINRVIHRKSTMTAIADAVAIRKSQSKYFRSMDRAIDLEDEARDYIEKFLEG